MASKVLTSPHGPPHSAGPSEAVRIAVLHPHPRHQYDRCYLTAEFDHWPKAIPRLRRRRRQEQGLAYEEGHASRPFPGQPNLIAFKLLISCKKALLRFLSLPSPYVPLPPWLT